MMPTMDRDVVVALKALSNPARLQVMEWLRDPHSAFAEYEPIADRDEFGVCVTHLAAKSGLAQSTVSTYMAALERAGLVTSTRVGVDPLPPQRLTSRTPAGRAQQPHLIDILRYCDMLDPRITS